MKLRVLSAVAVLALAGCERKLDMFGSNYDACLLQNATKGGDTDSRAVATTICKRHFERNWKGGKPFPTEITTTIKRNVDQYDGTHRDELAVGFWNKSRGDSVTKIHVTVEFYKGRDGKGALTGLIDTLEWDYDVDVGPEEYASFSLHFGDDPAPSEVHKATITPTRVLPHGNRFR